MENILISNYGYKLSIKSERLVVKDNDKTVKEIALSHVNSIIITTSGTSISTDLIFELLARNINVYFDKRNIFGVLSADAKSSSALIRKAQYEKFSSKNSVELAKEIILSKIANQKEVVKYFTTKIYNNNFKKDYLTKINKLIDNIKISKSNDISTYRGYEGVAASYYFNVLKNLSLLPSSFEKRTHQNSTEITNICLNYGYAILTNIIHDCVLKSGLDAYFGVIHTFNKDRISFVLDILEEYRAVIVDKAIIKNRNKISKAKDFNEIKSLIANSVLSNIYDKYNYEDNRLNIVEIIGKQLDKIKSYVFNNKKYYSYKVC